MRNSSFFSSENLSKSFGKLRALDGVTLNLNKSEVLGLIGPNGSGKTTFINVVSGVYKSESGEIYLDGVPLNGIKPYKLCRMGVSRTFQTPKPFTTLTVEENLKTAAFFGSRDKRDVRRNTSSVVEEVLQMLDLFELREKQASSLNSFQKKMLDLGRALATKPKILLLDELAAGLNLEEMLKVKKLIDHLKETGVSIIVVEHIMKFIRDVADRVVVLNMGRKIYDGDFRGAAEDDTVREVYLGKRTGA
jgi:branched-chain amino acid transport system ATP-binding protein